MDEASTLGFCTQFHSGLDVPKALTLQGQGQSPRELPLVASSSSVVHG